jgi:ABC-type sugar transport system permease subunit
VIAGDRQTADSRLARFFVAPVILIVGATAIVPIASTVWAALHQRDLRLPWLGQPFIGLGNFIEAAGDRRFLEAVLHTATFAAITVPIELALGLAVALVMHRVQRGRALVRAAALLPWAIPTVVAALVWRLVFDSTAATFGFDWFASSRAAWIPIAAADVWKTTPFVAVLLLAGLQTIEPEIYESARLDGASALRQLFTITVPLLAPAIVVAAAFRTLDALRLFDLPYVMTGGGPGTATEPLSLYAFVALMERLRFGYGSALSIAVFTLTFLVALAFVRSLGRTIRMEES